MAKRYAYEDVSEGDELIWGSLSPTRDEIIEFAKEFDPAPFHLDDAAAARTPLGRLSASGFHICAMAMRLICDSYVLDSTSQGSFGVDQCRWLKPVFPDDRLTGITRIGKKRLSQSRPGLGFVDCLHEMTNQHGETVLTLVNTGMFLTRERHDTLFGDKQ